MSSENALPLVAIVGRVNVGKSTLFNRITGRRRALVSLQPGMTRDRHFGTADWCGCSFRIVDTGGLEGKRDALSQKISAQARKAIEEAALLLFVVDGKEGLTARDEEIAVLLRRSDRPVLLLINKTDASRRSSAAMEFHELGFPQTFFVSAEHGTGVDEVLDHVIAHLQLRPVKSNEEEGAIRVAIVGKPNVGKSTFLNRLMGEERLITNEVPGTTRDVIAVEFRDGESVYRFLDTAGIRKKGQTKTVPDKLAVIQAIRSLENADVAFIMIDGHQGVTHQDAVIAGYARDAGTAIIILVNKMDLLDAEQRKSLEMDIESSLQFINYAPRLYISAKTGQNVRKIFPALLEVHRSYIQRVTTGQLNAFFSRILADRYLGAFHGKPIKLKYITQAGTKPPTFVLFTNAAAKLHFSNLRYVENQLRKNFGFRGTTIRIRVRKG